MAGGSGSNPVSKANLIPAKPGDIKNPNGRKGKDGTKGLSLKNEFKQYINRISADERDAVWTGLYTKAMMGDVAAIKLWVELNGERVVDDIATETDTGIRVNITLPAKKEE